MKILIRIWFFVFIALFFSTCTGEKKKAEETLPDGKALSMTWCSSCHLYPEPNLIDKSSWEKYMLPRMGHMLGIYPDSLTRATLIENNPGGEIVIEAGIYPEKPQISSEEWEAIRQFYLKNAPDSLPQPPKKSIPRSLSLFEVKKSSYQSPPATTLVKFQGNEFYIGDANRKSILKFDRNLNLKQAAQVQEGAVWLNNKADEQLITVMGSFSPTDNPLGFVVSFPNQGAPTIVADKLKRPVHTELGDFNSDGLTDFVTCEFGKWTGALSWFQNLGDGRYKKTVLRNSPGAIKSYVRDLDKNGTDDIVTLFGQGNEGIWAFLNDGKGTFTEVNLLRFSPSNGSSYFNFFDFNGDGLEDIIYCNGDNADFGPILKYYHGIHIYTNLGDNRFEETFYFQMNGAYNAIPGDFDLDGDIDIAAISFFPDFYGCPEESFVFLENNGALQFSASTISDPTMGRWIVMDSGDLDEDGDLDLLLGSLAFEVVPKGNFVERWISEQIPFIYLENKTK